MASDSEDTKYGFGGIGKRLSERASSGSKNEKLSQTNDHFGLGIENLKHPELLQDSDAAPASPLNETQNRIEESFALKLKKNSFKIGWGLVIALAILYFACIFQNSYNSGESTKQRTSPPSTRATQPAISPFVTAIPSSPKLAMPVSPGPSFTQTQPVPPSSPAMPFPSKPSLRMSQVPPETRNHQSQTSGNVLTPYIQDIPVQKLSLLMAMLDGSRSGDEAKIEQSKTKIESEAKSPKCKDKGARGKNDAGLKAVSKGDFSTAVQEFYGAYLLCPSDVEILNNLGFALERTGDHHNAEKALLMSLSFAPTRTNSWANLGQSLSAQGDIAGGIASFQNAFRFTRNPKRTLETLQNYAESDPISSTREAASLTLVKIGDVKQETPIAGSMQLTALFRPVTEKAKNSPIPVYLPSQLEVKDAQNRPISFCVLDNSRFHLDFGPDGYTIWLGTTFDCQAMGCISGVIYAEKGSLPTGGEALQLSGNTRAAYFKGGQKQADWVVFSKNGINYAFSFGVPEQGKDVNIRIAESALKLGPLTGKQSASPQKVNVSAPDFAYSAPTGSPATSNSMPIIQTGYVPGHAIKATGGLSRLTVDNTQGGSDVLVKVVRNWTEAVRVFYIRRGHNFAVVNMIPGTYVVRYKDLESRLVYELDSFRLLEEETAQGTRYSDWTFRDKHAIKLI